MLLLAPGDAWSAGESAAATDVARSDLAAQLVDELQQIETLRAENEWFARVREHHTANPSIIAESQRLQPPIRGLLAGLLTRNVVAFESTLRRARESQVARTETLAHELTAVRRAIIAEQARLVEATASKRFAGQLALLINVDNRWLWFGGVVAFLTIMGLFLWDRRHDLRRLTWVRVSRFRGIVAVLIVLLAIPLLPTVLTFLFGNRTYTALLNMTASSSVGKPYYAEATLNQLQGERRTLEVRHKKLAADATALRDQRERNIQQVFGAAPAFIGPWHDAEGDIRALVVAQGVQKAYAEALTKDLGILGDVRTALKEAEAGKDQNVWIKRLIETLIGGGLIGMVLLAGMVLQRSVSARTRRIARTCPRCMSEGSLVVETTTPMGTPITDPTLYEMRCNKVLSEAPFMECGFTFPPQYCEYTKLSFPTLGVGSSGKTHWLAMAYRELNHGRHPDNVHFERVRSRGSEEFDRIVDNILTSRIGTAATVVDYLPSPVIFNFRDNDWPTPANSLVNVFDFAGSITVTRDLHDPLRQRQLKSDGYLFFLDPTLASDTQAESLLKFREEVKLVKRLKAGQQMHAPVALCLTKIDLLPTIPSLAGGDTVEQFFQDLREIDASASGDTTSLKALMQKSELVSRLRDQIWPNWEIEKMVRALFGDRFLFFPMSPVGLDKLGERDLSQRTIKPYAIQQPLLWLLHMNGYPVLSP
jgi:hypothetical protein